MKDLLRIADLGRGDLDLLLTLGEQLRRNPRAYRSLLAGDVVTMCLATPSVRTRLAFGSAVAKLGGTSEILGPAELELGGREAIEDTARVMSRYARAIVVRATADDDVQRFASASSVPVINAGTDVHRPCQALADLLTLRQRFGRLDGLRVAYLGGGDRVLHSLLEACALAAMDLTVATPPGLEPHAGVLGCAEDLAQRTGATITTTHDPRRAVAGAQAVFTGAWSAASGTVAQHTERADALRPYQVHAGMLADAAPEAIFLHALPAHRGEEVAPDVLDGERSVVVDQAENRMHIAQALLLTLVRRQLEGAAPSPTPATG